MTNLPLPADPQAVVTELQATGYVADEALATSAFLLLHLGRPLLLEGPSGVGKTTLLSCLCGMLEPSEGSVSFKLSGASAHKPEDLRRHFGIVSEK